MTVYIDHPYTDDGLQLAVAGLQEKFAAGDYLYSVNNDVAATRAILAAHTGHTNYRKQLLDAVAEVYKFQGLSRRTGRVIRPPDCKPRTRVPRFAMTRTHCQPSASVSYPDLQEYSL